jgi:hypothetical protein
MAQYFAFGLNIQSDIDLPPSVEIGRITSNSNSVQYSQLLIDPLMILSEVYCHFIVRPHYISVAENLIRSWRKYWVIGQIYYI